MLAGSSTRGVRVRVQGSGAGELKEGLVNSLEHSSCWRVRGGRWYGLPETSQWLRTTLPFLAQKADKMSHTTRRGSCLPQQFK